MAKTLGVDHGTQALRFCLLEDRGKRFFEIERGKASKVSVLSLLERKGFLEVDIIGLSYSMADAIDAISDVKKIENRGQAEEVTGELVGAGTRLFDEIAGSGKRAVLIPGLHRGITCLDERFRFLYSHMAASEKVALAYHAYLKVNEKIDAGDLIISDISSNTVTIGIKDRKFFGAIDACLGALGFFHGPLDLGNIRSIDSGKTTANKAFYSAGVSYLSGLGSKEILGGKTDEARLALDSLIAAAEMEVFGLASIIRPKAIAVAGSAGTHNNVFGRLKDAFEEIAPVFKLDRFAAATGAAEIASDVLGGKKDFLGIGVDL
ncbi:MAG: methanogenesis marker 12 protein, partial [Candidatus Hydrothermarchaeales archaeon]